MADVLNRTTREFIRSVHEPDYPIEEWIINPDLEAVTGFDSRYWVITGDVVSLMDQAQRDAVDAAALEAQRDDLVSQFGGVENILRAFMLIVLDEFNAHAAKTNSIITATGVPVTPYPTRTSAQLITAIRNRLGS